MYVYEYTQVKYPAKPRQRQSFSWKSYIQQAVLNWVITLKSTDILHKAVTMSEYDTEAQGGDGADGGQQRNSNLSSNIDTRYVRSLEGIVKIIAFVS